MTGIAAFMAGGVASSAIYIDLTLTPSSDSGFGSSMGWTSPPCVLSGTWPVGSTIVWSIENPVDGTWSIVSGQGTTSLVLHALCGFVNSTTTCDLRCTVSFGGVSKSVTALYAYTNIFISW